MTKQSDFLPSLKIESIRLRNLKIDTTEKIYDEKANLSVSVKYRWDYSEDILKDGFRTSVLLDFVIEASVG